MIVFQQLDPQCYASDVAEVLPFALTSNQRQNYDFLLSLPMESARWEEVWEEQQCLLDEAVVAVAVEDATDVAAAEMFVVVAAAAAVLDEFERDVAVVGDNLQNTNHAAVETQTSSCLMLWWRSDFHVEMCLPNEMILNLI